MNRLRIAMLTASSLGALGLELSMAQIAHSECVPQMEQTQFIQEPNSTGGGYHEMMLHIYQSPNCPIDYYSTQYQDQYEVGQVMPTFHVTPQEVVDHNSIVNVGYPQNFDFTGNDWILYLKVGPRTYPYNLTITATNESTDLLHLAFHGLDSSTPFNINDAIVTWYALDGDDRIEGGSRGIDIGYGGRGNDIYTLWNNEDRAYENDGEGFDLAVIGAGAQNYRFDYKTSIEAIFLYEGGTVDRNYLPPGVIFLNSLVDNRGPNGGALATYVNGTNGNDGLVGGDQNQVMSAKGGTDLVDGGPGDDSMDGGSGNDIMYGGSGNDSVKGGTGNDLLVGGSGEGNDTYNGGAGKDTVKYTSAQASITVNLSAPTNQAYSTDMADGAKIGIDQLAMIENVIAGKYDDQVTGNKVANQLEGEDGNDIIKGEAGKDILIGGKGADVLFGGASVDKFTYRQTEETGATPETADTIADFTVKGEKIDLAAIDASTLVAGNNVFLFNGGAPIGMSDQGEVSVVKVDNPDTANDYTMVYIDTDADPEPEASIRLNGLLDLTIKNFVL